MFNLETLVKMPINPDGGAYLKTDGCGCAFGLAYAASHAVDWSPLPEYHAVAVDSTLAGKWREGITDEKLYVVLRTAELNLQYAHALRNGYDLKHLQVYHRSFNRDNIPFLGMIEPEQLKKWMIDRLVEMGLTYEDESCKSSERSLVQV